MNIHHHPEKWHFWASLAALWDRDNIVIKEMEVEVKGTIPSNVLKEKSISCFTPSYFCGWNDHVKAGAAILD